uniref:Putative armadillo/beta-catenin-like repeat-containing protein n=1 Tax=Nyssomyia neivai TaxID=330878 RepID=A0A1L8DTZ0_9DIPT
MDNKDDKDTNDKPIEQPKQPRNLQGLLKFALEATRSEDPTTATDMQMSAESREFLEKALKSMTVDTAKEMLDAAKVTLDPDASEDDQVDALEVICGHVINIDQANVFHQIGGYDILKPCLNSKYEGVRAGAAALVADIARNNTTGQTTLAQINMLQEIAPLLTHPEPICTNAMSAISSLVTNYEAGMLELFNSGLIDRIVSVLETRKENKLITKVTFFLAGIPGCHPEFVDKFLDLGIMKYLSGLIVPVTQEDLQDSQVLNKVQNILHATTTFCSYNRSLDDLRVIAPDLPERLKEIAKVAATDEAFDDIKDYAEQILKVLK